jgi:hypothetical protein
MEKVNNFFRVLAKGKTMMGLYTINMIALSWYAVVTKSPLDGSISAMYLASIGAYAASKSYQKVKEVA